MLWADTIQMVIMVGGFAATTITGIVHQGGLSKVLEDARISGRMDAVELVRHNPQKKHNLAQLTGHVKSVHVMFPVLGECLKLIHE